MAHHLVFTGTQGYRGRGMNQQQQGTIWARLQAIHSRHPYDLVIHHGGCVGADYQFHTMCLWLGAKVIVHTGHIVEKRAPCKVILGQVTVLEPEDTIKRNERMVRLGSELLAAPSGMTEIRRSGTWMTMRRARDKPIPITVAWRDGTEGAWP